MDYTRIVEYKHKPNQPEDAKSSKGTVIFKEFSCDHGEPYYPVPNPANRSLFEKYQKLAAEEPGVCFVGRLASYKYFNMDQAFLNALVKVCFGRDTVDHGRTEQAPRCGGPAPRSRSRPRFGIAICR